MRGSKLKEGVPSNLNTASTSIDPPSRKDAPLNDKRNRFDFISCPSECDIVLCWLCALETLVIWFSQYLSCWSTREFDIWSTIWYVVTDLTRQTCYWVDSCSRFTMLIFMTFICYYFIRRKHGCEFGLTPGVYEGGMFRQQTAVEFYRRTSWIVSADGSSSVAVARRCVAMTSLSLSITNNNNHPHKHTLGHWTVSLLEIRLFSRIVSICVCVFKCFEFSICLSLNTSKFLFPQFHYNPRHQKGDFWLAFPHFLEEREKKKVAVEWCRKDFINSKTIIVVKIFSFCFRSLLNFFLYFTSRLWNIRNRGSLLANFQCIRPGSVLAGWRNFKSDCFPPK